MPEDIFDDSKFGADSEMSSNTVDWGKVGDYIVGTFVKSRHGIETQYGQNSIYEFFAEKGQFHGKGSETPTVIQKGESWAVWGRNELFNSQLNSLRPGQIVKLQYVEDQKSRMGNPAKIIKIFAPKKNDGTPEMNQEWLDAQEVTAADLGGM